MSSSYSMTFEAKERKVTSQDLEYLDFVLDTSKAHLMHRFFINEGFLQVHVFDRGSREINNLTVSKIRYIVINTLTTRGLSCSPEQIILK